MLQVFDHHYVIIYLICKKIDIKDINLREGLSSWVLFRSHFSITAYFSNIVLPKTVKYDPPFLTLYWQTIKLKESAVLFIIWCNRIKIAQYGLRKQEIKRY